MIAEAIEKIKGLAVRAETKTIIDVDGVKYWSDGSRIPVARPTPIGSTTLDGFCSYILNRPDSESEFGIEPFIVIENETMVKLVSLLGKQDANRDEMIVSKAITVFPVERSPIISSRCPLPSGIILSIALIPVCTGVVTGCLAVTLGATRSRGRFRSVLIGPLPSRVRPNGSITRPIRPSPTPTSAIRLVRRTSSPSLMSV